MKIIFYGALLVSFLAIGLRAQAELKPGSPITVGETLSLSSARLKEEREIRVFLPRSYYANSGRRYPVIFALDGEGTGPIAAGAAEFMTGYSSVPQMPEAIVVAVINVNRNRDMPIPEGYGQAGEVNFLAFLADELIPAVEKKYRTQPLRILLGHSQGGLFAHYAMTARPKAFPWVLAIDAPLAGFAAAKPLIEKIKTVAGTPNFRGRLVSIENLYGWRNEWPALKTSAPGGFYGEQVLMRDETHETMAYKGVYEGLKRLFHDYPPNIARENKAIDTLPALREKYQTVSEIYGYPVEIPKELLLDSADRNIAIQHGAEAAELIARAVALYGESFRTERQMAEAAAAVKKGRNPQLEELMNLPAPAVEAMKPFLGIWERKQEATWIIAFEAKDAMVRAQNTVIPPTFEPFHLEVQFVRVLEGARLQWGERNGRGPGITVYTAKLVDRNTLAGTAEGIGFIMPRPAFSFVYKRRADDKK
jgi:uncharacterized protein